MDNNAKVAALASVIANVAAEHRLTRMRESATYSAYEMGLYEWVANKVRVTVQGSKVTLAYPARAGRFSAARLDGWATSLIEGAMEMLTGGPFEIDYRVGMIEFERPGCTSYTI